MQKTFKRVLSVLLVVVMLLTSVPLSGLADIAVLDWFSTVADAADESETTEPATIVDSGTCGSNLIWEFYSDGTLVISGEGYMDDYSSSIAGCDTVGYAPWKSLEISAVIIESGVTSIGTYAFYDSSLDSITFEEGSQLIRIEANAFESCTELKEIKIPASVEYICDSAFTECLSLESVLFDKNSMLYCIDEYAFSYCSKLDKIEIPASVEYINDYAFFYCKNLEKITIYNPECDIYDSANTINQTTTIVGYPYSTSSVYANKYGHSFIELTCLHDDKSEIMGASATCTDDGYTDGILCNICNIWISGHEMIEAFGHDYGEWIEINSPACEKTGKKERTCLTCDKKEEKIISALGHRYESDWIVEKEASCTVNGLKTNFCTRCQSDVSETIFAQHIFDSEWETIQQLSCINDGIKIRTCSVCNKKGGYTHYTANDLPKCTGSNYTHSMDLTFNAYSIADAERMEIHFTADSELEKNFDKLYVYEGNTVDESKLVGTYTGSLASTVITINSSSFTLRMTTDGSVVKYGFEIDYIDFYLDEGYEVTKALGHDYVVDYTPYTCTKAGASLKHCSRCDVSDAPVKIAPRHADFDNDGFCDFCFEPYVGVLDLVFVIDATGSMGDEVDVVKNSIQDYANRLDSSNIPYYIALIEFSDDSVNTGQYNYYNIDLNFSSNISEITEGISKLSLKGGSNEPAYSALINGLDELEWGDKSVRRVILIGDETPWDEPATTTGYRYRDALNSLNSKDVVLYSIATGGSDVAIFKRLATATEGSYYKSSTADEFAQVLTDIIDNIPETLHIHTYEETILEATCTNEGKTSFVCTGCLKEISNRIEPLGHDYSEDFTVDLAPTCTKEGSKSKHCSRCDEKIEITTLEVLGHNYVSERIEATDKLEEHTCYTCSRCKDSYIVLDPAEKLEGLLAIAGTYQISLSWLKAVEASVTGYNVYRKSIDETEFTLIKTITSRNTTSFIDKDVTAGHEYLYVVTALKDKVEGYMCEPVSCIPNADEEAPRVYKLEPSKSLNNVITGTVDFVVNAEDNIGVVKFELYYCVENSDDWKLISEYSGSSAKISFNTKSIDDGSYNFKAVAYDAVGNFGNGDIVKTYAVDNTGPEKVTGLTSKAIYASKATLAWQNVSDKDINHFILRRKINSGYEIVSNSITDTLGYNLKSLTPETEYTYSVAGVDHYGNIGEYSDDFSFVTVADTTAPVVSNVSPAPGRFNKVINFSAATEDDCNIYKIEIIASDDLNEWRVVAEKTFTDVKSSRKQSFSVSLDKFDEGNLFLAAVAYDNSGNSSPFGNESGYVQYVVDRSAPAAPKNVKATGKDRQIVVTWDRGTENDLGKYNVYRAQKENGEFTLVASNLAKLDYYDTSVVDGITYYYKISVNDSCGNVSDFSDVVFANLSEDNKKPVITSVGLGNGSVCGISNKTIGVLAQDNKYIREIVVEFRQENDSTYTVLSKKTYTDNNYYRILEVDLPINLFNDGDKIYVRAYCTDTSGLVSDYSADSVITVDKTAPDVSNVNYSLNGSKYTLSWSDNDESDISGYKVYYSKNGANYKVMATRGYTAYGTYSVSVTLDSGSYDIKLEAIDKVGNVKEYMCPSIVIQGSENFKLEAKIDCPSYFEVGVEETISAGNSVSSEGIISYSWDLDDDTTANSKEINKRYSKLGNYKIKLTIEDSKGNVATATKNIVVKERELLGTVKATVVDASSKPVKNAEVYFGLGEENQQIVRTNSSGVAELVMSVGTHSIGALADTTKYLPSEVSANVIANRTTEITLTLVQKPLIDLELEYHEMSFEEILESGIDLSASANKQFISGTITVTYTTTGGSSSTSTKVIEYVSTSDKIIDYTIKNNRPDNDDNNGNDDGTDDPYIFTPVIINGGEDEKIVAVLVMPAEASFLKQFYDVTLYVTNNAESRFSISDCEASLSVPSGLTVIDSTPISSTITGGSTASASWIVRGDTKGEYYISANFSGNLDLFDKHVSASITSSDPLVVRGLDGVTLRAVFNSMIKNNTLYYNFILENDSGYDIYAPDVDYQSIIDNLMIEAPKKNDETEIMTECLGVSLINADDIAETFDVDKTFDVLHDGEKIKYEFKTSGLANDDVVGYYTEGTVDCLPQFKDHIIVEEDYIYSYDGEEEIVKYTEKYADVFENQNGVVLRFFDNSKLLEGKVDYLVGSVSGDVHSKLKNVTVEYGNGQVKHVDEEFAAKYADVKGYDITIKSDGYRIKVIPAEAIEKWATYFSISQKLLVEDIYLEQDHKDGKPYITSAIGKENMDKGIKTYTDLMTSKLTVTGSVSCDIIIKADLAGGSNATYWLSQDEKHKISNNDGKFSAIEIHEIFDKNNDIYAYVMTENNGKKVASEPLKLSVEIQELDSYTSNFLNETTISLISTKGQSMELSEDVPLVGGSTISANLLSFPIGVEIEGSKVKISFGCDIFSRDFVTLNESKKNNWFDFKASVKKWEKGYEDAMKLYEASVFGSAVDVGKTFTLDFYGYLEGEIVNGSIVPIDMSASLKGTFKYKYTQQGAVYCIPAYCYVEAACAVAVKAAYARQIPDYNIPFDFGFVLTISPSLKLGAGAGIKDAISAGVFANGVIEYTNDFPNQHHKFKLTGTFGAEAAFFFLKWEKGLAEGTWTPVDDYYGDSKSRSVMMFSARNITSSSGNEEIFYSDADEAELVTRDYLTDTSEWRNAPITDEKIGATTGTLIESVYPNGENQIIQFGDKLMQVFIEDDANRDNYNFARLVYSVYDNDSHQWSNPKAVYDNGHFDSSAKLCVDEKGNVHVLWQKLDTIFNSENGTVEEILKNGEIYYASYDETTDEFVNVKKLSDDSLYDSLPSICIEDNKVVAYWVKNNENDLLKAGANSLVRCEIDGEAKTLVRELNYISDITSCDGEVSVIYDTDGDTTTVNDWTIASYSSSNGDSLLSEEIDNLSSVKYSEGTLYFATANEIGYFNDVDEISYISKNVFSSRNFTVVNDSAFWIEDNSLMYSKFENDTWSAPVVIESDDGNMSNMSVAEIGDYAYVVYSSTEINADEDGTESAGATDLKFIKVSQYVDLSVYLNLVDEYSILEGREDNIELYVENNGNTTVEKIEVTLTDTLGNDVCVTSDVNLAPGSGKIVKLTYQPKEGYANTVLTVTVSAVTSSKEKTPSNNTIEEIIGLCDLLIENDSIDSIGDNYFLSAMISNSSLITAENVVVKTYLGSLGTEPIGIKNFNTLAMGESLYANIPICKDNLIFDEDGSAKVYVVVSTASTESLTENNTICFVITNDDGNCGHPEKTLVSSEQATCISEGINIYVCDACGYDISEKISMLEHDIVVDKAIASTCTESGLTEGSHCLRCDSATVEQEIVPALDHDMITDAAVDPTCTKTGLTKGSHCSRCDSVTVEQEIIPALEHKIVVVEAVVPTCTETGLTEGVKCGTCGEILTAQTVVSMIDHTDNDGDNICDTCDFKFTGTIAPDPDTPDEPTDRDCNHFCHRSGIIGFLWEIVRFLQKLFGIQQYCDCGALHW